MDSTQDMMSQVQRSHDAAGFLGLGVEENGGRLHEAEPAGILQTGEGNEETGTKPKPEQRAQPTEGNEMAGEGEAKEGGIGSPAGLGSPEPMEAEQDDDNDGDDDDTSTSSDSDGEPGRQRQAEQALQANIRRPQRRYRQQQVARRTTFTEVQMQELERIFRRFPYPDLLLRRDIARRMNVTEARVQIWFKNRRRRQRAFILRNMHPMALGNPVRINLGVPQNVIFTPQPAWMYLPPAWMWYPQPAWIWYPQPLPLGLLLPPMLPIPPLFMPAPPPMIFPPLPHGGPHARVWAWFFSVFYP